MACLQMPQLTLGLSQLLPQHQLHLDPKSEMDTPFSQKEETLGRPQVRTQKRDFRATQVRKGGRHFRKKETLGRTQVRTGDAIFAKNSSGRTQVRTGDLSICSRLLYH